MFKQILVALDGSGTSNKALAATLDTRNHSDVRSVVRLIHVLDDMSYFTSLDPYASKTYAHAMRQAGVKFLADGLAIFQTASVVADTVLIDRLGAQLAETVAETAKGWSDSLFVVRTHGRKGVGRMLLGLGAEPNIRLAPCPVLVHHLNKRLK